jgi:hypothetical protein
METRNITSRISPTPQGGTGLGENQLDDCGGLTRWVAQLDAAQRQAHAAHVQDRIRILDQMLELVVNAKRDGRLHCDQDGCGVRTHEKRSTNAATTP